jgi:hypothetical protein
LEKQQLNNLIIRYKESKEDLVFDEIYREIIGKVKRMNGKIAKSMGATPEEVIDLYVDTLLRCIGKYDGRRDFENFYNLSVKRARRDLARHKDYVSKNEYLYEDMAKANDESEAATFDIRDDFDLEHTIISKKRADQWRLIDSLTKDMDAETTAIVQAYLTLPKPNPLAVEKATGICRKKVSRKLNRLAARFSTKQFGDYTDYLIAL